MKKVRVGIIGTGGAGVGRAMTILDGRVKRAEICAICDNNPKQIQAFKDKVSSYIPTFENAEELLDSGLVDAVIICTPHYFHPIYSMMAMKKGIHVLCEKPAGVFAKNVREMNAVADECDVVFGMMFNQRTNCVYRKMKEIVDSGEMGKIKRVNWIITTWYRTAYYYKSGDWRATWEGEGGGVLLNQCPHQLDLLQWICGMPSTVRANCHEGKWHDIEVEDDVSVYMEFPNGATGIFVTSTGDLPGTNRFEILFEKGKLVCDDAKDLTLYKLSQNEREFYELSIDNIPMPTYEKITLETDGKNEQHAGVIRSFVNKILDGTPLIAEGQEGVNGLELSNSMHLSSWLDKTITLPADEDLFLEELNKRIEKSKK